MCKATWSFYQTDCRTLLPSGRCTQSFPPCWAHHKLGKPILRAVLHSQSKKLCFLANDDSNRKKPEKDLEVTSTTWIQGYISAHLCQNLTGKRSSSTNHPGHSLTFLFLISSLSQVSFGRLGLGHWVDLQYPLWAFDILTRDKLQTTHTSVECSWHLQVRNKR